jgi:hypothetical protein
MPDPAVGVHLVMTVLLCGGDVWVGVMMLW